MTALRPETTIKDLLIDRVLESVDMAPEPMRVALQKVLILFYFFILHAWQQFPAAKWTDSEKRHHSRESS